MGVLGLLFVIAVVRMLVTYYDDQQYAKRGELPPRYQAKMAQFEAGKRGAAPARLGAAGYFRELWHDVWDDLHGHRQRIRAERKAGDRPTRRERVGAWWRLLTTPVGERRQDDAPEAAPAPEVGTTPAPAPVEPLPPGTKTVGDDGQWKTIAQPVDRKLSGEELKAGLGRMLQAEMDRRANLSPEDAEAEEAWRERTETDRLITEAKRAWNLGAWPGVVTCLDELYRRYPNAYDREQMTLTEPETGQTWSGPLSHVHSEAQRLADEMAATYDASAQAADKTAANAAAATSEGNAMTAPTGEVVNHETHVAELDAQIKVAQEQVDAASAFLASISQAKVNLDQMQQTYQQAAEAAAAKLDHEQALNLDSTTLGHAGAAVESMPPNQVNEMYDQFEEMEAKAKARLEQAGTALEALEAERAHVIAEYGEEFAKVAQNLGGDARYLDSGAGTTTGQPSTSEAFPFEAPGTRYGDERIPAQTIAGLYPEDMTQSARAAANR